MVKPVTGSAVYLDVGATIDNDGRAVYRVFRLGTTDVLGLIELGPDNQWRIDDSERAGPWADPADAIRYLLTTAPKEF